MTFNEWIKQFESKGNAFSDLANDIKNDLEFPMSNDFHEIRRYLNLECRACHNALSVFDKMWTQYKLEVLS